MRAALARLLAMSRHLFLRQGEADHPPAGDTTKLETLTMVSSVTSTTRETINDPEDLAEDAVKDHQKRDRKQDHCGQRVGV